MKALQYGMVLALAAGMMACSQQRAANENRPDNADSAGTSTPADRDMNTAQNNNAQERKEDADAQKRKDIVANLDKYAGQNVTLTGEINDVVADRAFSIGDGDSEILVIGNVPKEAKDWKPSANEFVTVTGKVQRFNKANIRKMAGNLKWEEKLTGGWEGKAVIIASKMQVMNRQEGGTGMEDRNSNEKSNNMGTSPSGR